MSAYYSENDPFAAAWLRELIKARLIADGEVDERSIAVVQPSDLRGFTQCHFFAGIGGWSHALRLAGWPDDREVWTGSCPCQPFSSAGAQAGGHDPRDLWPVWMQLVRKRRPSVVFGEQVEAAIGHGWLDRLCDDLEAEDYAVGACGLPGPSVGAFDIRNRLWFVAESSRGGLQRRWMRSSVARGTSDQLARSSDASELADTTNRGQREHGCASGDAGHADECESIGALDHAQQQRAGRSARSEGRTEREAPSGRQDKGCGLLQTLYAGAVGELGDTEHARSQGHGRSLDLNGTAGRETAKRHGAAAGFWRNAEWIACRDGKARPVEPGTFPLAHGVSARVGRLRGYGNAIKPPLAAEFIKAYREVLGEDLHGL